MTYVFSQRSLDNLEGVHPDLVSIAHRALELDMTAEQVDALFGYNQ
jgi:hypothetical protein